MTVRDVFELRSKGRTEEAYEAAREIYAADKSPYASTAMFLTASDMLQIQKEDGNADEADKIGKALERLKSNTPEHLLVGVWGEEMAVNYLLQKDYIILERDWHSSHRDIDIIAQQGKCIVFVEVKTRRNREYGDPLQAINYQKQKNLRRAINHYIHFRNLNSPWRFDVITIVGELGCNIPEISHIIDFTLR